MSSCIGNKVKANYELLHKVEHGFKSMTLNLSDNFDFT